MRKKSSLGKQGLSAALVILSAAIFAWAQDPAKDKRNVRPEQPSIAAPKKDVAVDPIKYTYEFLQPKFYVKHIVIEHDQNGNGTVTFERMNEDVAVVEPLRLSQSALARISSLWNELKFLDSNTDYQSSQQFPHLGTMRIGMQEGTRKRVAEFNWTHNTSAQALVAEYRKAADQTILVFDLSVARENQPLDAPKLMETLESLLNRNALSDAHQLLPLLTDISTDEHIPLIARNHALRLIKKIGKQ